jgi:hypothetical protein
MSFFIYTLITLFWICNNRFHRDNRQQFFLSALFPALLVLSSLLLFLVYGNTLGTF